jgi:hypothetical protein
MCRAAVVGLLIALYCATANAAVRRLECREHNSFGDDKVYQFSFDDTTNRVSVKAPDLGEVKQWKVQLANLPEILVISGIVPAGVPGAEHPGVFWVIDLDFSHPEMSFYPIGSVNGKSPPLTLPCVRKD